MTLRLKLFVLIAGADLLRHLRGDGHGALARGDPRPGAAGARGGGHRRPPPPPPPPAGCGPDGPEPGAAQALPARARPAHEVGAPRPGLGGGPGAARWWPAPPGPARPAPSGFQPTEFQRGRLAARRPCSGWSTPRGSWPAPRCCATARWWGRSTSTSRHEEVMGDARATWPGRRQPWSAAFWIALGLMHGRHFLIRQVDPAARVSLVEAAERPRPRRAGVQLRGAARTASWPTWSTPSTACRARLEERRHENERLIAELEERVEQKTREVLRADRLATLGGIAAGFAHEIGNSLNVIRGFALGGASASCPTTTPTAPTWWPSSGRPVRAAGLLERFLVFARARDPARPRSSRSSRCCARWWRCSGRPPARPGWSGSWSYAAGRCPEVRLDTGAAAPGLPEPGRQRHPGHAAGRRRHAPRPGPRPRGSRPGGRGPGHGPGMDEETRRRSSSRSSPPRPTGTGLGLAIVRQAVEAHGRHRSSVESRPGQGATFRSGCRLPAGAAANRRRRPDHEPAEAEADGHRRPRLGRAR